MFYRQILESLPKKLGYQSFDYVDSTCRVNARKNLVQNSLFSHSIWVPAMVNVYGFTGVGPLSGICFLLSVITSIAFAEPVGWMERFALAADRSEMLDELIPGSDDDHFYRCLHYQTTGKLKLAEATLAKWLDSHKGQSTPAIDAMTDRQRLLTYELSPQRTIDHLVRRLGIQLDHAPPPTRDQRRYPSELDSTLLNNETIIKEALLRNDELGPPSLSFLAEQFLADRSAGYLITLAQLLDRVTTPSIDRLADLVIKELNSRRPPEKRFGDLSAHRLLTLSELELVVAKVPEVADDEAYVHAVLARLRPGADVDMATQPAARHAYLKRVEAYLRTLPPSYNGMKAASAFRLLEANLARGEFDRELFLRYLQLPRVSPIVNPNWLAREGHHANLDTDFMGAALLPPIRDEQAVVRTHLEEFLENAESTKEFDAFLRPEYLRRVFAETKLMRGVGDQDRWYAMLGNEQRQAIRDSVELRLSPTNPPLFSPNEPTSLTIDIKNVNDLVLRIYEINTPAYYLTHDQPLDTDIDLDGLVASHETTLKFAQPAVRRHRESIPLPQLAGRGVWVVDLIGKSIRTRAMIRRGSIDHVESTTADGMTFTVIDENRTPIKTAKLWIGSRQFSADFAADDDGHIVIPLGTQTLTRKAIFSDGVLAESTMILHWAEKYELKAAMHIDRTLLRSGGQTDLLIRLRLMMTDVPIDPSVLKSVSVRISGKDLDGISSTREFKNLELTQTGELVIPIRVPPRLAELSATITGKVARISDGKQATLSADHSWKVAGIRSTVQVHDAFLTRDGDKFVIEVRGRNGELVPAAIIKVSLDTQYRNSPVEHTLQTDDRGRVDLGKLNRITNIRYSVLSGIQHQYSLDGDRVAWPDEVHAVFGEPIELPWIDSIERAADRFRLLSTNESQIVTDESKRLSIRDGFLLMDQLPPGDYRLVDRQTNDETQISVVEGPNIDNVAVGQTRYRAISPATPISIANVTRDESGLKIKLSGNTELSRVHIIAKRFIEQIDPSASLALKMPTLGGRSISRALSGYVSDLRLGDEYQYVLRRRYARKFPGVMLPQPGLILNPWETDETTNDSQSEFEGEAMPPSAKPSPGRAMGSNASRESDSVVWIASDFDFLADPGLVLTNLRPDQDGIVLIPSDAIDGLPIVQIVVCDPATIVQKTITSPLAVGELRDLRLAKSLVIDTAFSMQRSVVVASPDRPIDLKNLGSAQIQVLDSVGALMKLYKTLVSDTRLNDFDPLSSWDTLDQSAKLDAYTRLACHELHLFLWVHDRSFFDDVIRPYLANKKEKQFVDHWLLEDNLNDYTELWRYNRLNAAERALLAIRVPTIRETIQRGFRELVAKQEIDYASIRLSVESALKRNEFMDGSVEFDFAENAPATPESRSLHFSMGELSGSVTEEGESLSASRRAGAASQMGRSPMLSKRLGTHDMFSLRERSGKQTAFFRDLDSTRQWAESHWDRVRTVKIDSPGTLIATNAFWSDLAAGSTDRIDVSSHLLRPIDGRHSALVALAFCGLPTKASEIVLPGEETALFVPPHPVAIVTKRLQELKPTEKPIAIMIGSRFTVIDDPEGTEVVEFLAGVAYRGHLVLSNPTAKKRSVDVLWQLPTGTLPLNGNGVLDSRLVSLDAFAVSVISYDFYFPESGSFAHYPATVAEGESLLARAPERKFNVLEEPTVSNEMNWEIIARTGDSSAIGKFLDDANLHELDWMQIAHRMGEADVYHVVLDALAKNRLPIAELWAYSMKHHDESAMRTYLSIRGDLVSRVGPVLNSSLLKVDPIEGGAYEMLEYSPLVLARVHRLTEVDEILNPAFLSQYRSFLSNLAYSVTISPNELLSLAHYLLIQNRIGEAMDAFEKVDRESVKTDLQYDYMDAYLAMHQGEFDRAEKIVKTHADHSIPRWHARFAELQHQLNQRRDLNSGEKLVSLDDTNVAKAPISEGSGDLAVIDREARQASASRETPEVLVRMEGTRLRIDHRSATEADLNYFGVDLELLFSKAPFVRDDLKAMAMVRPTRHEPLKFTEDTGAQFIELDEKLRRQTLLIEVVSGASRATTLSYGGNLTTYVSEAFGQLQTTDSETKRPISAAYVKVYAKYSDDSVRFFKDGYTDSRGRFDYASLSAEDANGATRYAILVLSEEQGATLHDVAAPTK